MYSVSPLCYERKIFLFNIVLRFIDVLFIDINYLCDCFKIYGD